MRSILCTVALVLVACVLTLRAAAAPRDPATVKLVKQDLTLVITFDDGKTLKVTSEGTKLPAGTYFVKSLRFYKKDEKNRTWELRSMENLGGMKSLTVAAGQEKVIDPGPPIGLHFWARQGDPPNDREVALSFTAVGQYDAVYYPGAFLGNRRPGPPVFRIVTEDDKTLHEGRFNVTESTGACHYTWRIPTAFKGKFKVDIKAQFGPYPYGSNREGHLFEIK